MLKIFDEKIISINNHQGCSARALRIRRPDCKALPSLTVGEIEKPLYQYNVLAVHKIMYRYRTDSARFSKNN